MATTQRRRRKQPAEDGASNSPPRLLSQEDEADILAEVGGHRDEDGDLIVDEAAVREIGAVDATAVRENRLMEEYVAKKRGGERVSFNSDDLLQRYEVALKLYPANTLDITVRKLTGSKGQHMILSRPRSGAELYEALKGIHGQSEEADYEVRWMDTIRRIYRGTGRITMPDTRSAAQQQGQPMSHPTYPPGYPPQQGYAPQGYAPPQQPAPVSAPDMPAMVATFQQMFEMFQRMQPQPHQAAPVSAPAPSPLPQEMAAFQQIFELFQRMQSQQAPPQPVVAPPPPPVQQQPAPDMSSMMSMVQQMFEMFQKMQPPVVAEPRGPHRPAYYDPRRERDHNPREREYDPRDSRREYYDPPRDQSPAPPTTASSPTSQFRDTITFLRTARSALDEIESLNPNRHAEPASQFESSSEEDDSPVRIVDAGGTKLLFDKETGALRKWDTGLANIEKIFKWGAEQRDLVLKERARQDQRALPPEYVRVAQGYQAPPGYTVDQENLPPAPRHMPSPINEPDPAQQPPARRNWGAPPDYER